MNSVFDKLNKPVKNKFVSPWVNEIVMNAFWDAPFKNVSDFIYLELDLYLELDQR